MAVVYAYGAKFDVSNADRIENRLIETGLYEWPEISVIQPFIRPNSVAIDVGANIGIFSMIMARCVAPTGKVYAFEPLPVNIKRLEQNVLINQPLAVEVVPTALGSVKETKLVEFKPGAPGAAPADVNYGGFRINNPVQGNLPIEVDTLDAFVQARKLKNISFMKIDVEGFEMNVLRGGAATIRNNKPSILIEMLQKAPMSDGAGGHAMSIVKYMAELNYVMFRVHRKPYPHLKPVTESDFQFPIHFNAMCCHQSLLQGM